MCVSERLLTCCGVDSAATLCRLRHRDAHLALETVSDQVSSSSPPSASPCCLLEHTPQPERTIIHRDRLVMTPLLVASIFSSPVVQERGAVKTRGCGGGVNWWKSTLTRTIIAKGGARGNLGVHTQAGSGCWEVLNPVGGAVSSLNSQLVQLKLSIHGKEKINDREECLLRVKAAQFKLNLSVWSSNKDRKKKKKTGWSEKCRISDLIICQTGNWRIYCIQHITCKHVYFYLNLWYFWYQITEVLFVWLAFSFTKVINELLGTFYHEYSYFKAGLETFLVP